LARPELRRSGHAWRATASPDRRLAGTAPQLAGDRPGRAPHRSVVRTPSRHRRILSACSTEMSGRQKRGGLRTGLRALVCN
jgi:hypothetical protein